MKKFFVIVICLLALSMGVIAQASKGTWLLGGSLSFSTSTNNYTGGNTSEYTSTMGRISPSLGYFITDKLVIGINPGFLYSSNNSISSPIQSTESDTRNFSIGPFMRYYQTLSDKVSIFGQAGLGFNFGKTDTDNIFQNTVTHTISDNFGINVGINPGIVFFPTRRLGFEATFGTLSYDYSSSTTENTENKNTSLNLNLNISSLGLGVQYYLGR